MATATVIDLGTADLFTIANRGLAAAFPCDITDRLYAERGISDPRKALNGQTVRINSALYRVRAGGGFAVSVGPGERYKHPFELIIETVAD